MYLFSSIVIFSDASCYSILYIYLSTYHATLRLCLRFDLCVRHPFHTTLPLSFSRFLLITPLSYLFLFVCLLFILCLSATRCKFYYESPRRITFPSEFVIVVTFLRYFLSESVDFCRFSSDNRHKMICENTSVRVLPFHVCFDRVYIRRVLTPLNAVFRIIPPPTLSCLAETRPRTAKRPNGVEIDD